MSERKQQVWFRPDQAELTLECLRFVRARCTEANHGLTTETEKLAKRFVTRRILEIEVLFEPKESA